jgi:Predicted transcriptional regulator
MLVYICIKKSQMEKLTKAEEEIMLILWELEKAFVKEIIACMPSPKPHYNTVSTLVKILIEKGAVAYNEIGNSHQYYPLLSKEQYRKSSIKPLLKNYFDGSAKQLVSFLIKDKKMSVDELEQLLKELKRKSN